MESCNLRPALAERLKKARLALGYTQSEWHEASGMPLPTLKGYEGSKAIPGGEALCLYARAGVRVDWLLTGEGPMLLKDMHQVEVRDVPEAIDEKLLALCIQGVYMAEPGCPPDKAGRSAVAYYFRLKAMDMESDSDKAA
jgi:transcriptional regulator with XRE-family HTH domain